MHKLHVKEMCDFQSQMKSPWKCWTEKEQIGQKPEAAKTSENLQRSKG